KRFGDREAQGFRCFEVYSQLKFGWQLNRKLRRFCATENAIDIGGRPLKFLCHFCSIRNQTAVSGPAYVRIDRRYPVSSCQQYDERAMNLRKSITCNHEAASRLLSNGGDGLFDFGIAMNGRHDRLRLKRSSRSLEWGQV